MESRRRGLLRVGFRLTSVLATAALAAELSFHVAYAARNALVTQVPLPYVIGSNYGPVPPWIDGLRILEPDPTLIWKGRPRLRRTYGDVFGPARTERDRISILHRFLPTAPDAPLFSSVWDVTLNAEGFRTPELSNIKPAGTIRIVCLGDSWTFGANVGPAQTYPQQFAARLASRWPAQRFEVLNLGVLGYSSFQGLQLLERVLELRPDIVVVGFGMNDSSVAGYRDKDVIGPSHQTWRERAGGLLELSQMYRFVSYRRQLRQWEPPTPGEAIARKAAESAGRDDFDYSSMEQWTRVSPADYEANLRDMIRLITNAGADVVLLFNEIWTASPYRDVAARTAESTGAGFVDTASLIHEERSRIEKKIEDDLDLTPPDHPDVSSSPAAVDVVFRVRVEPKAAARGVFIVGADPQLGALAPNHVSMHDDGTHGDQRAGDGVWSYMARFAPGREVFYVYTTGGLENDGMWTGLDVPDVRGVTSRATTTGRWYAPIDTFGQVYMQADRYHTNEAGYARLAEALVTELARRGLRQR